MSAHAAPGAVPVPVPPVAEWLTHGPDTASSEEAYAAQAAAAVEQVASSADGPADVAVQLAAGRLLVLTANEAFFDSPGRLQCIPAAVPSFQASTLNNGEAFQGVGRWSRAGDKVKWGFVVQAKVPLTVDIFVDSAPLPIRLVACVDDADDAWRREGTAEWPRAVPQRLQLPPFTCKSPGACFSLTGLQPGFHTLSLWLATNAPATVPASSPVLSRVHLTAGFVAGAADEPGTGGVRPVLGVARLRSRPDAAHVSFRASAVPLPQAWVFCLRKTGATLGAYSPLTTPFGYVGDTFNAAGKPGSQGMNFSLWSFRAGAASPPLHQHACLLGIGHPGAEFDRFTHEGTGVKVRGFTGQWDGNVSGDFVYYCDMALVPRPNIVGPVVPAVTGTAAAAVPASGTTWRFRSFFWDEKRGAWKFFAEGEQYFAERKAPRALQLGGFVEVPGGTAVERSGHVTRSVAYYGFASPAAFAGEWFPVDGMHVVEGGTVGTKSWRVTETGGPAGDRFVVSTGGFLASQVPLPAKYVLPLRNPRPASGEHAPLFMQRIAQIMPPLYPVVLATGVPATDADEATVVCRVCMPADTHTLTVFWGPSDCRAFADLWPFQQSFPQETVAQAAPVARGSASTDAGREVTVQFTCTRLAANFLRVLVQTPTCQLYSLQTTAVSA